MSTAIDQPSHTDILYAVLTTDPGGRQIYWGEGLRFHSDAIHRSLIDGFDWRPSDEADDRADDLDFWFNRTEAQMLIEYLRARGRPATIVALLSEQSARDLLAVVREGNISECEEISPQDIGLAANRIVGFHTGIDVADHPCRLAVTDRQQRSP